MIQYEVTSSWEYMTVITLPQTQPNCRKLLNADDYTSTKTKKNWLKVSFLTAVILIKIRLRVYQRKIIKNNNRKNC